MPFSVNWYIENEVIYVQNIGMMTADELRESLTIIVDLIENSPRHLVHVISDVTDVIQSLKPLESLQVVRDVGTHDRIGWTLILGEKSTMLKMAIALGTTVFKNRTRAFDTIDEAEAFLREMDTVLNWDQADRSIFA